MGGNRGYASLHSGHPWPSPGGQHSLCKYAPGVLVPLIFGKRSQLRLAFFVPVSFVPLDGRQPRLRLVALRPSVAFALRAAFAVQIRSRRIGPAHILQKTSFSWFFCCRLCSEEHRELKSDPLVKPRHPREGGDLVSSIAKASVFGGLVGNLALDYVAGTLCCLGAGGYLH